MIRHGKIIEDAYKDCWGGMDNIIHDDGSINWGAAFRADPGVVKCGACGCNLWAEARVLECPCGARVEDEPMP